MSKVGLVVGLSGGIASGKSTVETAFAELDVPIIDADQVARDVVAPGEPALRAIAEAFGDAMLSADGTLNRSGMRKLVFSDDTARARLEAITHPAIRQRLMAWRNGLRAPYGILSAALLVEMDLARMCDRVLIVDAPVTIQHDRLMARDGIDSELAKRMLAAQTGREQRLQAADDVLRNTDSVSALVAQVPRLHAFYMALARGEADPASGLTLP